MMRKLIMAGIAMMSVAIFSCDDETTTVGNSTTTLADQFVILTDTFDVATRSIKSDSVMSKGSYTYLGRIKDPETGSYISSDFSVRFTLLEKEAAYHFPSKDLLVHFDGNNNPIVDSCFIRVMVNAYQGDSLEAMKLVLRELAEPLREDTTYYTNYDPEACGKLRATDKGGIYQSKFYSISDLTLSDSLRDKLRGSSYYQYIQIPLNRPYVDRNNRTYNNYGTYIMQSYYEHPEYFKNSTTFAHHVCPGFYLKTIDGLGVMIEVAYTQLILYYRVKNSEKEYTTTKPLISTSEVLQTMHITNDNNSIEKLVQEDTCTYLKTPAGIYTEITLPVDQIKQNHENDTITSAKISFNRMNVTSDISDIVLEEPTNLLMVERDSLYSFFEHSRVPDNLTSFIATFNSKQKTYSFSNISTLINHMYQHRNSSPNWNKAVLVPVQLATTSEGTSSTSSVSNEMNINSVRLVGGDKNRHKPVRISVIYNKNR